MKKVLYVARFSRSYSTEVYVEYALNELGVDVRRLLTNEVIGPSRFRRILKDYRPNLVLFSKTEPKIARRMLEVAKELGIITVCWCWDLYYDFRSDPPPRQFRSNLLLTTDGGHEPEFRRDGYNHRVLRQGIHGPHYRMVPNGEKLYLYDVAFVGGTGRGYHVTRNELVGWLKKTYGIRFIQYNEVRDLTLNLALSRVKVVVGDSYPTPRGYYWSNRIYEILGRGGVFLHPHTVGLDSEFTPNVHYVPYHRADYLSLRDEIDSLLEEEDRRERMRLEGFKRMKELTYVDRCKELLELVEEERIRRLP